MTKNIENNKKITFQFKLKYETLPGQEIFIYGDNNDFGNWNKSNFKLFWSKGNIWTADYTFPEKTEKINYKFVLRSDNEETWEEGENRILAPKNLKCLKKTNDGKYILECTWNCFKINFNIHYITNNNRYLRIIGGCNSLNNWSTPIKLEYDSNKKIKAEDGNIIEGFWTITILFKNNDKNNYKFDYRYSIYDDKLKFSMCEREPNRHINLLDKNNNLILNNSYLEILDKNFVAEFNFDKMGDKNIFIGPLPQNIEDYKKLKENGITAIINLNSQKDLERRKINLDNHKKIVKDLNIELIHFPIIDFNKEDLSQKLKKATDLLKDLLKKEKIVYVHCTAGMTISAAIVISYLIIYENFSINDAKNFCKKYRPVICPNMEIIKNVVIKFKPNLENISNNFFRKKNEKNFNEFDKINNENSNLKNLKKKKKKLKSILFKTTIFERRRMRALKGIKFNKKVKFKEPVKPKIKYKKMKKITEEEKYPTQLQIINKEKQEQEIKNKKNKKENIKKFGKPKVKNTNKIPNIQKNDSESYHSSNKNSDNEESESIVYINYKYDQFNKKNNSNKKNNYKSNFQNNENDNKNNENSSQSSSINNNNNLNTNKNINKKTKKNLDEENEEKENNNDDEDSSSRKSWSEVRRESESISRKSKSRSNMSRSQSSDSSNSNSRSYSESSSGSNSESSSSSLSVSDKLNLMKTSYSSKKQKVNKKNNKKYGKSKYDEYEKISKIKKRLNNIKMMNKNNSEESSDNDSYYNKSKYSKSKQTKNKKIPKSVDNAYNNKKIKNYNNNYYNINKKKKKNNNDDYSILFNNSLKFYKDKNDNKYSNSDESKSDGEKIIEDDRRY